MSTPAADSPLRDRMVFLVGARRSGTNFLQRVLAAHPAVLPVPSETYVFASGLRPLSERIHHAAAGLNRTGATFMERDDFIAASRVFCDRIFGGLAERLDPGAERIVERTPWHAYDLELIGEVYPDAWVIQIIRDGRDVARSLLAQPWGPETMAEAAEEWRSSVAAAAAAPKPARYAEVRYERLLADPRARTRELFEFLDIDASGELLERVAVEAGTLFNVDPGQPDVGAGKWRSLPAQQLAEFEAVAGALNAELGYGSKTGNGSGADRAAARGGIGRRLRSGVGARLRGDHRKLHFQREIRRTLKANEATFERLLVAIHSGDGDRVRAVLSPSLSARVVDGERTWNSLGDGGREKLLARLLEDPAFSGRQQRGDVNPGVPYFSAYLSYRLEDGSEANRFLVARISGEQVTGMTVYDLDR